MKGNGSLDDRAAAAASSFTTFHTHPLNPFAAAAAAARVDVGHKRPLPDAAAAAFTGDGHAGNTATATAPEAAASSSPPSAPPPTSPPASSKRPRKPAATTTTTDNATAGSGDGATIEVVRRPRGRPPGSKNKPKQTPAPGTTAITVATSPSGCTAVAAHPDTAEPAAGAGAMRPHILEVPAGHDVAESLASFSRRRDIGVSALAATGPVSNVTLRQPHMASSSPTSVVTLHGRFDLLSISATFFPPSFGAVAPMLPPAAAGAVSVSLAGPHGQIVGGAVAGPLVAAGTVTVIAATFGCPSYHRLPLDDDLQSVSVSVSTPAGDTSSGGGGGGPTPRAAAAAGDFHVDQSPPAATHPRHEYAHHHTHPPPPPQHHHHQQQHHSNHHHQPTPQPEPPVTSLPISTSHLLSDVIWAPRDIRRRPY